MIYPRGAAATQCSSPTRESLGPNGSRSSGPCGQFRSPALFVLALRTVAELMLCEVGKGKNKAVADSGHYIEYEGDLIDMCSPVGPVPAGCVKLPHASLSEIAVTCTQPIYHSDMVEWLSLKREELDASSEEFGVGFCKFHFRGNGSARFERLVD